MESKPEPTAETQHRPPATVMDVVAAPPPETSAPENMPDHSSNQDADQPPPDKHATKKPAPPKQASNGVGMAIFATVVIVIALAALATYAYLKQSNNL